MKTFKSQRGPFTERPYYSDREIENICADELRGVGLLPVEPAPVRIDRFIEKRFQVVPSYESLPKGVLGLTQFSQMGPKKILVSEELEQEGTQVSERRVRSTLAHEAGHCLLHAHLFALASKTQPLFGDVSDPERPKVLCRDPQEYRGDWWEFQANLAMGILLLPAHLVQIALEPYLQPAGLLGLPDLVQEQRSVAIKSLAEVFDVNPIVVRIRLEKMYPVNASMKL